MDYDSADRRAKDTFGWWIMAIIIIGFVIIGLVVFFPPEVSTVGKATAFGQLERYEEMSSGAVRVWLQGNDESTYCTTNPELITQIKERGGDKVVIEYITVLQPGCLDPNLNDDRSRIQAQRTIYQLTAVTRGDR